MKHTDKLLVRVYDVGFGDCIYIRVPDRYTDQSTGKVEIRHHHILIDCGSTAWQDARLRAKDLDKLERALKDVRRALEGAGRICLDLLVVTHPHADHFNGFDPTLFEGIAIEHIWLSSLMKKDHPQAKNLRALQALAYRATWSLLERGLSLGPGLREMLRAKQQNAQAQNVLERILPGNNGISPLYVWRDIADPGVENRKRMKAPAWKELAPQLEGLQFKNGTTCLEIFEEKHSCLRVLAPEWDIDGEYLGKAAPDYQSLVDRYPSSYPLGAEESDYRLLLERGESERAGAGEGAEVRSVPWPGNISREDFRALRSRLFYSALRFTGKEHEIVNNTSVVLLLEWRGRRLLFTGDAQWKGGYTAGEQNGCWDVMLKRDGELSARKRHLSSPLDFLKVGHHASVNGMPFVESEGQGRVPQPVLEAFLPFGGQAEVVVSTCHTDRHPTIPCSKLLEELGGRGKLLLTNNPAHLNYPETNPFAVQIVLDAVSGLTP
ncbi:MAG: hypothetical protein JXA14_00400 [Anaerolineae bacterium]|nr:hypothetical protein [Anaerolineae bacterium]